MSEISLRNPAIRRTLVWQLVITALCAAIAAWVSGEHGLVSAVMGGLTNVFASVLYVFVANMGLRNSSGSGLWPLLRAELVKLVFIVAQLALTIKFYDRLVIPALFATFLVTLLAWRIALLGVQTKHFNGKT